MNSAEKAAQVEELRGADEVEQCHPLRVRRAEGPQVTELRRQVRATRSSYRVVKNTLALRAAKGTPLEALSGHFVGATAVAYNEDNPVGLAKVLTAFAKTNPNLVFKAALVDGLLVEASAIKTIAELPSREGSSGGCSSSCSRPCGGWSRS
jgi:large subunit ribosomal protein L10